MAETKSYVGSIAGSIVGILLFLAALLLAALETTTTSVQTPPGPDVAAGSINGAGYVFHRWPAGRSVFLWHDLPTAVAGHGSGTTADDVYTYAGRAGEDQGPTFDWEAWTTDGLTVGIRIADQTFTLAEDAVFLVRASRAGAEVQRLARDLAAFAANHQGAVAMVSAEPAVAEFVSGAQRSVPIAVSAAVVPDLRPFAPAIASAQAVVCPDLMR